MKDRWSQLSLKDKSDLMSLYIRNGISSLEEIKKHYNSFADGGRVDNNPDKDPVLKNRKPKANFYQRLLNPFRQTMPDWENRINNKNNVATHKLSWVTDSNGNAIVYPNVQEINGRLYDFTDPRNKAGRWDALDRAIQTGDTIQITPEQANFWTQHYKEFYPSFNFATGGQMNTDDPDEPSQDQTITVSNPLFTTKGTLSQEDADWDLGNQYTFKDTMRGIGLAGDYFSSEGFRNRANIANEKYGYLYNIEKPLGRTIPQQAAFIRGDNNANAAFKFGLNNSVDPIFVGAHETGHHNPVFNNYTFGMTTEEKAELSNPESTLYSPLYRNDYRNIPEDWRNILRNENPINDHDAELSEAYSDLVGLRALLKAYGIFDSTDPKAKFTQEMLNAFRKKLGNKDNRFLDYHSDENIIRAINEIAYNSSSQDTSHYAALGGLFSLLQTNS